MRLILPVIIASLLVAGCTSGQSQIIAWPLNTAETKGSDYVLTSTPDGQELQLEIADTNSERQLGLSNRNAIGSDGMLFVYDAPSSTAIWMKDMQIPIDIAWLSNGKIVHTEQNILPEPGVADYKLTIYESETYADAVLEMAAGGLEKAGLSIGSDLKLEGLL